MLTPQAWLTEGAEYQGGEDGIGTEIRLISLFIYYTIKLPDNSSNNPLLTTCHFWVLCECLFYRHACSLAACNSPACFESLFCSQLNQALQVCLWGILTRPPRLHVLWQPDTMRSPERLLASPGLLRGTPRVHSHTICPSLTQTPACWGLWQPGELGEGERIQALGKFAETPPGDSQSSRFYMLRTFRSS